MQETLNEKLYNKEKLIVSYKVKFYNDNFVSILKESSLENSSPSDFLIYSSFNYFKYDSKVYNVELSEQYYSYLQNNLWKLKDFDQYFSYVDKNEKGAYKYFNLIAKIFFSFHNQSLVYIFLVF